MLTIFKKASAKKHNKNTLLEAVLRERPDLKGQDVKIPAQGMMSKVIIIGNEVFKAPNGPGTVIYYDKDLKTLKQLAGKGLPVPELTCTGKESTFFGMTLVNGVTLNTLPAMTQEEEQNLAKSIASFIVRLAEEAPAPHGLCLQNPDINGGNILVNPETKKLEGIIDFGDAYYGPVSSLKSAIGEGINDDGITHMTINGLVQKEIKQRVQNSPRLCASQNKTVKFQP